MLEIVALVKLCMVNARNARANGKRGWAYVLLTILLWFAMELAGAVAATFVTENFIAVYITALAFAILGGVASHALAARKKSGVTDRTYAPQPVSPSYVASGYIPMDYVPPGNVPPGNVPPGNVPLGDVPMDYGPQEKAFTKKEINSIRHPRERRIYTLAVLINIAATVVVASWFIGECNTFYQQLSVIAQESGTSVEEMDSVEVGMLIEEAWYNPKNQQKIKIYMTAAFLILFTVAALEFLYAQLKARAVKVTPKQFGEIHEMAVRYAAAMGLKKTPEVYLIQENGALNAFASNVIRKRFIIINIDLLEIAYRQYNDLSSIGFVLAHEMAHIRLKHVSVCNRYSVIFSQILPIIGPALSRVREYSCDRLAQAASGDNGIKALMALTMGKHLYKNTDVEDYLESSKNARGFWIWIVNLCSSHPILPKRIRALSEPAIHGKIF